MTERACTLIIGAMPQEVALFRAALEQSSSIAWGDYQFHLGRLEQQEVIVVNSGIGKVLAAMVTQYAITHFRPVRIILTGLAGGLVDHLQIGDIVLAETLIQHDMDASALGFKRGHVPYSKIFEIPTDPQLRELALTYTPSGYRIHIARVLSGDQFIAAKQRAAMGYLTTELNGDCVEMEGASVALVAQSNQIACLVIRTISDRADGAAPAKFEAFLGSAAERSLGLVRHLLTRISNLPGGAAAGPPIG